MSTGNISKKRKVRTHDIIRSSERVGDARGASPGAHPAMTGVRVANRVLRPAARSPPGVRGFRARRSDDFATDTSHAMSMTSRRVSRTHGVVVVVATAAPRARSTSGFF